MRCSSSEPLLAGFADGTLSVPAAARIAQHLRGCPECAQMLDDLKSVDGLLSTAATPDLPTNFTFAVMAEVRHLRTPQTRGSMPVWSVLALYLLAAWSAVAVGFSSYGKLAGGFGFAQDLRTTAATWLAAGNALGSALHPAGAPTLAFGAAFALVLTADALACAAIFVFYRRFRPHLVAQLAVSEGA